MDYTEIAKPVFPNMNWDNQNDIWDEEDLFWDITGYHDIDRPTNFNNN